MFVRLKDGPRVEGQNRVRVRVRYYSASHHLVLGQAVERPWRGRVVAVRFRAEVLYTEQISQDIIKDIRTGRREKDTTGPKHHGLWAGRT